MTIEESHPALATVERYNNACERRRSDATRHAIRPSSIATTISRLSMGAAHGGAASVLEPSGAAAPWLQANNGKIRAILHPQGTYL
jgi:hypothetical protein